MKCRLALVFFLLSFAAASHADTANVKKGHSQLQFRTAAGGASTGATASAAPSASEKDSMFRRLDLDGDGFVSKAEAAGNAPATLGFDRADRNRDGKLSFGEYDSIGKPRTAKKSVARSPSSASAGATKKPN